MVGSMRVFLFANDSYFSYQFARPIIESYSDKIEAVFLSQATRRSLKKLIHIAQNSHLKYILYRSAIEIITNLNKRFNGKSVENLCSHFGLPTIKSTNLRENQLLSRIGVCNIGITINFDQLIPESIINHFQHGIINFHASRLPYDKGISPALWAFARGDDHIWGSIYRLDGGLDTGPIFSQFYIPVRKKDTAFSLYTRVCREGSRQILPIIEAIDKGRQLSPKPQSGVWRGNYWSWPDQNHLRMMNRSRRSLISVIDIFRLLGESEIEADPR